METHGLTYVGADKLRYPPRGETVAEEVESRCNIKLRYAELPCLDLYCFDGTNYDAYVPLEILRINCGCISRSVYYRMFDYMRPYNFRPDTLLRKGYRSFYYCVE